MEENPTLDRNIPQWKRDLLLRRRAVGRVLPTGSGSVELTCPSAVAAVRFAEYSVNADFSRRCESGRDLTGCRKNMRLVEQVASSNDFVEPCVVFDIKEIITKIESGSSKMGEEKNTKVITSPLICEKKLVNDDIEDNASDSSEEFKYGPGIVSKLKSKYLSLTLRESQGRVRPPLDSLRRATSLENILDEHENQYKSNYLKNIQPCLNENQPQRCRGLARVNKDSMKRARSVEVLTRCDRGSGIFNKSSEDHDNKRKIRNRISSSSVEETELPPPDLVKHTLKIFESSQTSTVPLNIKKKNQNSTDSKTAKKPSICPKPTVIKQNGIENAIKTDANGNINKNSDTKIRNVENSTEKPLLEGTVGKRKVALLKDMDENLVVKKSSVELGVTNVSQTQEEEEKRKVSSSSPPLKEGLTLDLIDAAIPPTSRLKESPFISTSPKARISESPEPKRCISPVLVRAPPCILSTELNSTTSPPQHMKQVGVIRPIVTNKVVHSNIGVNKLHLSDREIEKNLINKVKSIEQPVTKVIVSLKKSPEECFVENDTSKKIDTVKKGEFWDKKPNTMVFNFTSRKMIPDYIENDGLILAPRKEKPKLEPGIILFEGGTEDSSTDFESDELYSEPPLPCDVIFEGDNVLINGKSNIQSKPKLKKMKIQFNDEATTLFEYPSESSLLDDLDSSKTEQDVPLMENSSTLLPNPFRCSNLASYTPSKLSLSTDFQLGVTKTSPPLPPKEEKKEEKEKEEEDEETEKEEEYLRPADESSTVSWSAETATDLLF